MAKRSSEDKGKPEPSFEEALEQLEAIIERIEQGKVGLEVALAEYERGVELVRRCREILTSAEQRVEELGGKMVEKAERRADEEE